MNSNTATVFALGIFLIAPLTYTSAENSGKGAFDLNKAAQEIDALVEAGLTKHDLKPNAEINDETFVRRLISTSSGAFRPLRKRKISTARLTIANARN